MSIPRVGSADDESASESDEVAADYYEPISMADNGGENCLVINDDDSDGGDADNLGISYHHVDDHDGYAYENPNIFANGVSSIESARNGISIIDVVREDHVSGHPEDDEDDEEEEEERLRGASETAILAAYREDDSRRTAPLPPERSSAIVSAMRNVSFDGMLPSWAHQIPEDQWINRLRQLREQPTNES